jgi:hypothetical protein
MNMKKIKNILILLLSLILVASFVEAACQINPWCVDGNGNYVVGEVTVNCVNSGETKIVTTKSDSNRITMVAFGGISQTCANLCGNVLISCVASSIGASGKAEKYPMNSSNEGSWTSTTALHKLSVTVFGATPASANNNNAGGGGGGGGGSGGTGAIPKGTNISQVVDIAQDIANQRKAAANNAPANVPNNTKDINAIPAPPGMNKSVGEFVNEQDKILKEQRAREASLKQRNNILLIGGIIVVVLIIGLLIAFIRSRLRKN